MGLAGDISSMMSSRLAYKVWLVKDESDLLLFTDQRYLRFVRIMMLLFTVIPLFFSYIIFKKKDDDVPFAVALIPCFFSLAFLATFFVRAFSHKEVELDKSSKKITVRKMKSSTVVSEIVVPFSEVKYIELVAVKGARRDGDHYGNIRNYTLEILIQLSRDREIHFAAINSPDEAKKLGSKLEEITGAPFKQKGI
ncbi:MAG: hypothetical protein ACJ76F_06695 [Bacteroidia bacterium]